MVCLNTYVQQGKWGEILGIKEILLLCLKPNTILTACRSSRWISWLPLCIELFYPWFKQSLGKVLLKQWRLGFAVERLENCVLVGAVHLGEEGLWKSSKDLGPPLPTVGKQGFIGQPLLLAFPGTLGKLLENCWFPFLGKWYWAICPSSLLLSWALD